MKFSAVFSVFLAALSAGVGASPIPLEQTDAIAVPDGASSQSLYDSELDKRGKKHEDKSKDSDIPTVKTDAYEAVAKVGKDLQPDKYYAFYITSALKSPPVKEEAPHINEARKQLGYQHIYYAVGKVTKSEKGPKKNRKNELNFTESMQWDLRIKEGDKHEITFSNDKWAPATDKRSVHFVGEVSEKTVKKLKDACKLLMINILSYPMIT